MSELKPGQIRCKDCGDGVPANGWYEHICPTWNTPSPSGVVINDSELVAVKKAAEMVNHALSVKVNHVDVGGVAHVQIPRREFMTVHDGLHFARNALSALSAQADAGKGVRVSPERSENE